MTLVALMLVAAVVPGLFENVIFCGNPESDNYCAQGTDTSMNPILAIAIMHPPDYTETTSGALTVNICVEIPEAVGAVERAIATWNLLTPTTGNCVGDCFGILDPPQPDATSHGESIVLHELGHCAFGLGHPTLVYDPPPDPPQQRVLTEYTATYGGSSAIVAPGVDGIQGSADDVHSAGTEDISWYRRADNNPVIVDSTVIDINTFSRSPLNLPKGSDFPANANKSVAAALGVADTRAVMYPLLQPPQQVRSLSSDDVNMVKMANTGIDITAGTSDDYFVELVLEPSCSPNTDIRIRSAIPEDTLGKETLAACLGNLARVTQAMPPFLTQHYTLDDFGLPMPFEILINDTNATFDWGVEEVFADGFESGNTSAWDDTTR